MAKSPFEKVRSLVERKKLFSNLLSEKTEVLCKGEGETIFHFIPTVIVQDSVMQGYVPADQGAPDTDVEVMGNFSVEGDRYFFRSRLKIDKGEASIDLNCDVYLLQRRASMRLRVPSNLGFYLAITEYNSKPTYLIAQFVDLSAGGARVFFSDVDSPIAAATYANKPPAAVGDKLKAVLHLAPQKTIELKCEVKHIQPAVHYGQIVEHLGLEFVDLGRGLRDRLLAASIDLQQKLISEA